MITRILNMVMSFLRHKWKEWSKSWGWTTNLSDHSSQSGYSWQVALQQSLLPL